jgi:hypothetical protein
MSNIVEIKPKRRMPEDFGNVLRKLADQCDRGEVTGFVAVAELNDEYTFFWPCSWADSLMLASLLQHQAAMKILSP